MGQEESKNINKNYNLEHFLDLIISDMKLNEVFFNEVKDDIIYINKINEINIDESQRLYSSLVRKYIKDNSPYIRFQKQLIPYPNTINEFQIFNLIFVFALSKKRNLELELSQLLNYLYSSYSVGAFKKYIKRHLYIFLYYIISKISDEVSLTEIEIEGFKIDDLFKKNIYVLVNSIYTLDKINVFYEEIISDLESSFYLVSKRDFDDQIKDSDSLNNDILTTFLTKYKFLFDILGIRKYYIMKYGYSKD